MLAKVCLIIYLFLNLKREKQVYKSNPNIKLELSSYNIELDDDYCNKEKNDDFGLEI